LRGSKWHDFFTTFLGPVDTTGLGAFAKNKSGYQGKRVVKEIILTAAMLAFGDVPLIVELGGTSVAG
jgi:hypothetical protein